MAKETPLGMSEEWTDPQTGLIYEVWAGWTVTEDKARASIVQIRAVSPEAEVSQAVVRRIPLDGYIEDARDAARDAVRLLLKKRLPDRLEAPRAPRTGPGRPSLPDELYERVANLYLEAKLQGGQIAKRPNVYVLDNIREEYGEYLPYEEDLQLNAVRKWVHRSRATGFLPTEEEIAAALRGDPHPRLLNTGQDAPKTTRARGGTKKGQQ